MRALLAFLVSSCLAGIAPAAEPASPQPTTDETWYRVELGGQPAGWMHESEIRSPGAPGGGTIESRSEMELRLDRGGQVVAVRMDSRFVETTDGRAIEMSARQAMGQVPVTLTFRFRGDHLELETRQGVSDQPAASETDTVTHQTFPLPAPPWLPPAAASRFVAAERAAGHPRFGFRTLDPGVGAEPFEVSYERLGEPVSLALPGESKPVRVQPYLQSSIVNGAEPATVYLDDEGRAVKTVMSMLGAEMTLLRTDRATALRASPAPEIMIATFVKPDRVLREPRKLRRAVYRLHLASGALPSLPSAGSQMAVAKADGAEVTVDTGLARATVEPDLAPFREASSFVNFADAAVRRLATEALRGVEMGPEREKALALRAFVHRSLRQKDLATGFATASEVAQKKTGDCTEHAVLLAALLRATGIPSRVVMGLLYVEEFAGGKEIFGYHMWTQARLGDAWVDLDAMLDQPFDAAHIALATSALSDREGFATSAAGLAGIMGRLAIEVVEVEPNP